MEDISLEEAIGFFRNAGFIVLTDEDLPPADEDEDAGEEGEIS